jgi:hypothetical protein
LPIAVDRSTSFAVVSHSTVGDYAAPARSAQHQIQATLSSPDTLRLERGLVGTEVIVSWSVVSWAALRVQRGEALFVAGAADDVITLDRPVDSAISMVFLPVRGREGRSFHSGFGEIGNGWFTGVLQGAGRELLLHRAIANAEATVSWAVIDIR